MYSKFIPKNEKNEENDSKNYNLEAIIILTDKFGTLVKNSNLNKDISQKYNKKIDEIIEEIRLYTKKCYFTLIYKI